MNYMILVGLAVAASTTFTAYKALKGKRGVVSLLLEAVFMIALLFLIRTTIAFWVWYLIAISVALLAGAIAVRMLSPSPAEEGRTLAWNIFVKH